MDNLKRCSPLILYAFFLMSCSPQPTMEVPVEYQKGQKYFHKVCSNCHGSDAMGKHTQAPRLIDEDFISINFSDEDIRAAIIEGADKMPPQRRKASDQEITEIIKYLRYSQKAAGIEGELEADPEEEEEYES